MTILTIGTLSFDLIGTAVTPFRDDNLTIAIRDIIRSNGGRGANFAVLIRALGIETDLVASVGNDFLKSSYRDDLLARGVGIDTLHLNPEHETPQIYLFSDVKDSRVYAYRDRSERAEDQFREWAGRIARRPAYSTLYCTSEVPKVNAYALQVSPARIKVFSPAHDLDLYDESTLKECIKAADIVVANASETQALQSALATDFETLRDRLMAFITTVGVDGSFIQAGSESLHVSSYKPNAVVDTTGAGDAYAAGFVASLAATGNLREAARMGSVVASFMIESLGCQTAVPTMQEVRSRLAEAY